MNLNINFSMNFNMKKIARKGPLLGAVFLIPAFAILAFAAAARGDVFYAVSNYSSGSVGTIRSVNGEVRVSKNLVNNLGRDAFGYTFTDPSGSPVAMVREYEYGPDDHILLYDPYRPDNGWKTPLYETRGWVTNIHGARSGGKYLYVSTYEHYAASAPNVQLPGELARIDMENGYTADRRIRPEEFQKDGRRWHPHGEGVFAIGDYVYALWSVSSHPLPDAYRPSEIWKMTKDLELVGKAYAGRNIGSLSGGNAAFYNGKLYVAAMGGWQGPGTWGDLHEVDADTMESRKVLDGHDIFIYKDAAKTRRAAVGIYGITFAPDGTAFILCGSYDGNFDAGYSGFFAGIYRTTAERLSRGDPGEMVASYGEEGFSWSLVYDRYSDALWAAAGKKLQMYDKAGKLLREFQPNELGDNLYSVSVIGDGGHIPWTHAAAPAPNPEDPAPEEPDPPSKNPPSENPPSDGGNETGGGGGCSAAGNAWLPAALAAAVFRKQRV
ncbi:MAG: hypothetical protein LBO82_06175 [Synergistaceae bacterium]|jgi:hypothetical protein|nr:hypothetical protein [Synergistaceae bacterium]